MSRQGGMSEQDRQRQRLLAQATAILGEAVELCGQRSGWTQRVLSRDRHSHPVNVLSERATRFCLFGALIRGAYEVLGIELPFAVESKEWTPDVVIPDLPPPLELAVRVCGFEFARLLAGEFELREGQPVVIAPDGSTFGPMPWQVFVSSCNDGFQYRHVLGVLRLAQDDLLRRLPREHA